MGKQNILGQMVTGMHLINKHYFCNELFYGYLYPYDHFSTLPLTGISLGDALEENSNSQKYVQYSIK
jgi:hypothetical protein